MNKLIHFLIICFFIVACTKQSNSNIKVNNSVEGETIMGKKNGRIMQIVKLKTELSEEELLEIARERESQFKAISGIVQKYYIKLSGPGEYGGVYIWDSLESLENFKNSELANSIPKAYKVIEPPSIEIVDIMFELRD